MTDELWRWDATDLAHAIRTRAVSAREALDSVLARMDAVNPRVNAVVDAFPDEARSAADAADAAVRRGDALGPLHGVPVTVKINIDYAGRATTNGVVAFRNLIAPGDHPVVRNWRQAGAVIFGRTNTPAFSLRWFTDNDAHGRTLNPFDAGVTPGGSSGGASAALAAGIGPLAHGNDIGGSVRYPAYACGLVGLRPTFGRVPTYNPSSTEERPLCGQLMSVQGPLARSVRDVRLGLRTMAVRDPRDPWWVPAPHEHGDERKPCRVAVLAAPEGGDADPAVVEHIGRAAAWLADAGYAVETVAPPRLAECAELWHGLLQNEIRMFSAEVMHKLGDAPLRHTMGLGLEVTPVLDFAAYQKALARRSTLLREWLLFLERHPLVLTAISWRRPLPVDADQVDADGTRALFAANAPLFVLPLLGLPGLAVPTGVTGDGVPIGVQLIGSRFHEERCLVAGEVIEARCGRLTPIDPRF